MDAIIGTGKISKREHGIIAEHDVTVPMSDGINIYTDVFRPDGDGKFPALVAMSAFNKEIQSDRIWPAATRSRRIHGIPDGAVEAGPTDFFVRRGYVHIIGSVRGTGKSGGAYNYLSPREVRDVYEVIEWAAGQSWCDGNVGMIGMGYFAALHTLVAALEPPHLKCIVPIGGFMDNYREFWYPGGILQRGFARWLISLLNLDVHTQESLLKKELGEEGYQEVIERALKDNDLSAAPEIVEALNNPDLLSNASYLDIILHPMDGPYWRERDIDYHKIKVPIYLGAASHRPGPFNHWHEINAPKKLISFPPSYMDRPYYQVSWEQLRWFDYWLKDIDTGIMDEPTVKIFVNGSSDWLMVKDFPVPGTRWIPFNLHENRSLCEMEPWPQAASASYDDAPRNRGSLKYYSAPMVENTEIAGPIVLNLYASCRGVDMNLFVSLWDADPEGKESRLTEGYLKASHRELDKKKSKPWLPYHTHTNLQPLVPGLVYPLSISLNPTANLFKVGHRIALKISSSDDRPQSLYEVGIEHLLSQTPTTITIYHSAEHPSHLLLPITKGNIVGSYVSGGDISLGSKEFMKLD
jgi:predicted acyl esterase